LRLADQQRQTADVILVDWDLSAIELLVELRQCDVNLPVVLSAEHIGPV
jgi:DNA-binding response OmpR family regulator